MERAAFDLVMFDLDGTLVQTAPEICDAVNDTLAVLDLPAVTQAQVERWIGHGTRELLVEALAHGKRSTAARVRASDDLAQAAAEFGGHYQRRCGSRSRLYPRVRETLSTLRGQGVKLAVVTNKEARFSAAVLDAHRLSPLLDLVVSGDTLPTRKPDPAGIERCLSELGVPRERSLFVGDSSVDVATARNAAVTVWALPYGYNRGQPVEDSRPDRMIADCSLLLHGHALAATAVAHAPAPRG